MILQNFDLFPYSTSDGEKTNSSSILKARREELGLSQQQVAQGAELLLKQYQRLEVGERLIEGASLKTALAICAVLRLDPYLFLRDAEKMNAYYDRVHRELSSVMNEKSIYAIFLQALSLFNKVTGADYSPDNIVIRFCTLKTIHDQYIDITNHYGFHAETRSLDDFRRQLAEAFVGPTDIDSPDHHDGILLRIDPPAEFSKPEQYMSVIVHELAHIYACTHEIASARYAGKRFYDLYCSGTPSSFSDRVSDGQVNSGYAVWREFIADYITNRVIPHTHTSLVESASTLQEISHSVRVGVPSAKVSLSSYLSIIMDSEEYVSSKSWSQFEKVLTSLELPFVSLVQLIYENLHSGEFYEISLDFIKDLGSSYMFGIIQNTPPEELMAFVNTSPYSFS